MASKSLRGTESGAVAKNGSVKCSSSAQTEISALPHQWRSETHLIGTDYCLGGFTLPSKHNPPKSHNRSGKNSLRWAASCKTFSKFLSSFKHSSSLLRGERKVENGVARGFEISNLALNFIFPSLLTWATAAFALKFSWSSTLTLNK